MVIPTWVIVLFCTFMFDLINGWAPFAWAVDKVRLFKAIGGTVYNYNRV